MKSMTFFNSEKDHFFKKVAKEFNLKPVSFILIIISIEVWKYFIGKVVHFEIKKLHGIYVR